MDNANLARVGEPPASTDLAGPQSTAASRPPQESGRDPSVQALHARLAAAKRAFTTRRADLKLATDLSQALAPMAGDLLLAGVAELGQHPRIELPDGRRARLYPGDEIIVAYGARYAPDQFEAVVPEALGPCDLVAGGGVAAQTLSKHTRMRAPTAILPLGILTDASGGALNVRQFALPSPTPGAGARNVIAVVGTSMNAGKTTLAANLIRGLTRCGLRVGACKVTGTGSGGDIWSMIDAGAVRVLDFTDAGFATTAGLDHTVVDGVANSLITHLENSDVDVVVVEIADGLLQRETAALLSATGAFAQRVDSVVLAAADAMGACAGVQWLEAQGLPLRAVSGLVTASPLAIREAAAVCGAEIVETRLFCEPEHAGRVAFQPYAVRAVTT
jgi:Molybdopterin guanine dinucleotide synthesis protein B